MNKMSKYQLYDIGRALVVYCLIIIALFTISGIAATLYPDNFASMTDMGTCNAIFAFVMGICIYKEHWLLGMQNSISRKEFFKGSLVTCMIFNLIITLFDSLINWIFSMLFGHLDNFMIVPLTKIFYEEYFNNKTEFSLVVVHILFGFLLTTVTFLIGFFIASVYCRIPKKMRTLFVISLPVFIFGCAPILAIFFPNFFSKLGMLFFKIMGMINGAQNPLAGCVTFAVTSVIFALCGYGFLRKTEV